MRGELIGFGDKDLLYGKKRREVSRTISTFWIKQLRIGITVRHEKWTSFFFFFLLEGQRTGIMHLVLDLLSLNRF